MTESASNDDELDVTDDLSDGLEAADGLSDGPDLQTGGREADTVGDDASDAFVDPLDVIGADGDGEPAAEDELAEVRAELREVQDRHLRLAAEFNNFRRRTDAERLEAWSRAQADIVGKFVDVLDDLHRVAELDLSNATVEAIMEGVDLVERKFVRMLGDVGVEMIEPEDAPFDPERMEAMMRVPAESEEQDDVVAQVFQKGYALKGILVRPARVSVFKHG